MYSWLIWNDVLVFKYRYGEICLFWNSIDSEKIYGYANNSHILKFSINLSLIVVFSLFEFIVESKHENPTNKSN